jgi:DNA-binding MarR family transcriptional regulator
MAERFSIEEGWVVESAIRNLAAWYNEYCPDTSAPTFEAHLMVLRAYVSLASDSPLEKVAGLSRPRYNILRLLYQEPDRRLLMSDFAEGMNVSPTNITKLIDSLVADGLVTRVGHDVDKRRRWAELTPKGARLVQDTLHPVSDHVSGLWDCLEPSEKKVLVHLLSKMRLHWMSVTTNSPVEDIREFAPLS